ncbi:MAG: T9SS type A sorting domain-containing protein [Bacteroidetes bacterium]|nr:T9SS type A sorting domain-containing protein [Bacteroidota bacterium]
MNNKLLSILLFFIASAGFSQGYVKVMQYNLLYYGNTGYGCDDSNNNTDAKNGYLSTIIGHVRPDILTVNEMAPYGATADGLLENALNTGGRDYYQRATVSGSYPIANMLFYNSMKLTLAGQEEIYTGFRVIDVYRLYYNSPDLALGDTAYITCIAAHLKAGSEASDEATRADMTNAVMDYLTGTGAGNYLFQGDFNLYNSNETAYQNLINHTNISIRFYDPVSAPGDWGTYSFKDYHTQSTHSSDNGCASTGGMDDRFDFILASGNIMNGTTKVQYVSDSYITIGQDGEHYNQSINSGTNNSAPDSVIQALYGMSDHLPVSLVLQIAQTPVAGATEKINNNEIKVAINNPVNERLNMYIRTSANREMEIRVVSVLGTVVARYKITCLPGDNFCTFNMDNLGRGLYFLRIKNEERITVKKFIKQ